MNERNTVEVLRSVTERTLRYDFSVWFWGDAIAIDGLLDAADALGLDRPYDHAKRYLESWSQRPLDWVDHLTPGSALLRVWEREHNDSVLEAALRLATRLNESTPRASGAPLYRPDIPSYRHAVWVDSIYHVPPILRRVGPCHGRCGVV